MTTWRDEDRELESRQRRREEMRIGVTRADVADGQDEPADPDRQLYRVTAHFYVKDDLAMLAMETVEGIVEEAMLGAGGDVMAVRVVKARPATADEVARVEAAER